MSIREYRVLTYYPLSREVFTNYVKRSLSLTTYPPLCVYVICESSLSTTALSCLLHRWQTWKHFSVLFQCFPCWKTRFFFALPFCFWMLFLELQAYRSMYIPIWFWLWICLMVSIPECRFKTKWASSHLATTIHKYDTDWVIFVPYTYAISYGCTHGGLV